MSLWSAIVRVIRPRLPLCSSCVLALFFIVVLQGSATGNSTDRQRPTPTPLKRIRFRMACHGAELSHISPHFLDEMVVGLEKNTKNNND